METKSLLLIFGVHRRSINSMHIAEYFSKIFVALDWLIWHYILDMIHKSFHSVEVSKLNILDDQISCFVIQYLD